MILLSDLSDFSFHFFIFWSAFLSCSFLLWLILVFIFLNSLRYHRLSAERLLIHRSQRAELISIPERTRKAIRGSVLTFSFSQLSFSLPFFFFYLLRMPSLFLPPKLQPEERTPSRQAEEEAESRISEFLPQLLFVLFLYCLVIEGKEELWRE
jgi:hypothetical protein